MKLNMGCGYNNDFFVQDSISVLDEPYATQLEKKLLAAADLDVMCREWNNVVLEIQVVPVARKKAS